MNKGHAIVDLLDLLVEIAAAQKNQSKKEKQWEEPQSMHANLLQNSEQHQSKTKSGGLAKKQKA